MGLLVLLTTAAFIFIPADSIVGTAFHNAVDSQIQIEANAETGLTDFNIGGKEFSLDVQPLDYSKMND